jgi:hypothetical protein
MRILAIVQAIFLLLKQEMWLGSGASVAYMTSIPGDLVSILTQTQIALLYLYGKTYLMINKLDVL